jgi:hypothetical protein
MTTTTIITVPTIPTTIYIEPKKKKRICSECGSDKSCGSWYFVYDDGATTIKKEDKEMLCFSCYQHHYTKMRRFLDQPRMPLPNLYKHFVKPYVNRWFMMAQKSRKRRKYRASSNCCCNSDICARQRIFVLENYAGFTYREKMLYFNRCNVCKVFHDKKKYRYCPCCRYRMKTKVSQFTINKTEKLRGERERNENAYIPINTTQQ